MRGVAALLVWIWVMSLADAGELLRLEDLVGPVFESVRAEGTNLFIKFRASGVRYSYSIDNAQPKINGYGEELRLPIGAVIRITGRETQIIFSPLPSEGKEVGFHVLMIEDHRSGGKTRREKDGNLIFVQQSRALPSLPDDENAKIVIRKVEIESPAR